MSGIFGALGLADSDRSFISTIGQRSVYDASQTLIAQYNADLNAAINVFVGPPITAHTDRYYLPGGGRLQRRGSQAQSAATKAYGSWDVAYPLEDFGAQLAETDIALAYMTMDRYDMHLDNIMLQDMNTVRFELLKALFVNTTRTFVDPIRGSLTIQTLANGDAVTYPPVLGSETEATENHYLESGYAASSISDTNNPYVTVRDELEEHFGATQGGSNIVAWINPAQTPKTEALTDFSEVPDRFVQMGAQTEFATNLPAGLPGERVVGRVNGVWVVEWRWIPSGWAYAQHLEAPKPLNMRVDPADTGLGVGLQLVSEDDVYPFSRAFYRHRFGFGAANRLNGVVLEFGTGGTYTIPTAYQ